MSAIAWILISILALLILFGVLIVIFVKRKKLPRREPDYYTWFWIGIVWIGAGIPLGVSADNWGIFIMGIVFAIIGLSHKKEWKKNHCKWKDLTPLEKRIKIWVIVILGILVLAGLITFFILGLN